MTLFNDKELATLLRAFEALHRTTGITGHRIEGEPIIAQGFRADARVEIEANGQRYPYLAEIKRVDRFATLRDIKAQYALHGQGEQPLLVAPRITTETAEKCRELDLQFIDATGNAYLGADAEPARNPRRLPTPPDAFPCGRAGGHGVSFRSLQPHIRRTASADFWFGRIWCMAEVR